MNEELFDVYNLDGSPAGRRQRSECHGNPELLHRAVHVVVFHPDGKSMLLQKRKMSKDIQPGKWDTAVGGHLNVGEDYSTAALRELKEELGVDAPGELEELFNIQIRNEIESEDVRVYKIITAGKFTIQESELDEIAFLDFNSLFNPEKRQLFTPNLCTELDLLLKLGYINFVEK